MIRRRASLDLEPLRAVDLREGLTPARAWGPLELEGVRAHGARVQIALAREAHDDLASALAHLAELGRRSGGRRRPELLLEL